MSSENERFYIHPVRDENGEWIGFDADMAMRQKVSPVTYIFRAKAISGYEDRHIVEIEANDTSSRPLTPEEIAKNLPEMIDDGMIDLLNEVNE